MLDEREGMTGGPFAVVEAFRSQRHRFLTTVSSWDASFWRAPTRCTLWSVHDVVRHVRDVVSLHVARLGGPPAPFPVGGPFDPATSPATWLAASEGQSPEETLDELKLLIDQEARLLEHKAEVNPPEVVKGQLRRTLHWSVSSAHTFWDAWMHERDIVLCTGPEPVYPAGELRAATMYGLLAAAAPAGWEGRYVRTTVALDGSPDGCYEITHADDSIRVTAASPQAGAELSGPVGEALDSLAGRGPEPREVFGSSAPAVARLTLLRKVAT
ncbi:maleylpyruvate isomerase N-terminal domain-containing protein [Streptomyces sp. NPDC014676]|uniref:maleylpyruvate isomerase N-terminal domain-containing protein n=1 Tax=Streptomyces sp. NPDC014676 TaxID=3364879 RepID=UPI0036FAC87D